MPPVGHRGSVTERFWAKVQKTDTCWLWVGATNDKGYGQLYVGNRLQYAHRVSYILAYGDLPDERVVRHECDTPNCVRPEHLLEGSQLDNMRDMIERKRDRKALGTKNGRSKLTEAQALEIDALLRDGNLSLRAIGRAYGVGVNTVIALRNGVTWSHVTGR